MHAAIPVCICAYSPITQLIIVYYQKGFPITLGSLSNDDRDGLVWERHFKSEFAVTQTFLGVFHLV